MSGKKVLIVGGGGREHALAWKVSQSPQVSEVLVAPGNAGTASEPAVQRIRNVAIAATDIHALGELAAREHVTLTIVGPEGPLAEGIVDHFRMLGLRCFGPTEAAAELEASKAFAKEFLARHRIPTAEYKVFSDTPAAEAYIRAKGAPIVIKADGLAAGKGVVVADTVDEAVNAARDMLSGNCVGHAGARVVVEEFLKGEEVSFIAMVDGRHILPLATSQDHKRVGDGDTGPNTGGMGAYSPAPVITPELFSRIMREVMEPTVEGMAVDGRPFTGFLYAGLMISPKGEPKVLEFNARMGDPETQPIMMRLKSDLVAIVEAAVDGRLDSVKAEWDSRVALGVVMAAGGYPGTVRKGDFIEGLDLIDDADGKVFHAGTTQMNNQVRTDGGRVLCVCGLGSTVKQAQDKAYSLVRRIQWKDVQYRKDIGWRAIAREEKK
nr:phosphoribosylamine--glycine ligase [uncultured bacterium]